MPRHLIKFQILLIELDSQAQHLIKNLIFLGYLSGDKNLINAYQSGYIYIHTAKLFGMVPEFATKETHPEERKIFKVLYLANSYGQGT